METAQAADDAAFEACVDRLSNNPIYALSLGSLELFHSNALCWILKNVPGADEAITGERLASIEREKHRLDILAHTADGRGIVAIENKVKSVPDLTQLQDYTKKLDGQYFKFVRKKYILLSLTPPAFALPKGWTHLSYGDLSRRMDGPRAEKENAYFLSTYTQLTRDLDGLIEHFSSRGAVFPNQFWFHSSNGAVFQSAESIGFTDTLAKLNAGLLRAEIEANVREAASGAFKFIDKLANTKEGVPSIMFESGLTNNTLRGGKSQ